MSQEAKETPSIVQPLTLEEGRLTDDDWYGRVTADPLSPSGVYAITDLRERNCGDD